MITALVWSWYIYELEMALYDEGNIFIDRFYKRLVEAWDNGLPISG